MMNDFNDMMNLAQQLQQDPKSVLSRKFNIPQGVDVSNPNTIIQHLLNTGQVTQQQINNIMGNPLVQKLFNR